MLPRAWLNWIFPFYVWSISNRPEVCLTFDDGPHPAATPVVLDFLKDHGLKALFFCVGAHVKKHPELYERILQEGHSVGNHTFNHEHGWKTSCSKYVQSVAETKEFVDSVLFRPPYGKITGSCAQKIRAAGYAIVMWSWLSYDYDPKMTHKQFQKRLRKVRNGDILVFHDNENTAGRIEQYLAQTVMYLQEKNIKIVPFSHHESTSK